MQSIKPIRVTKKQACELLAVSSEKLRLLVATCPTFPKLYKAGTHRQSAVYFDYQDLLDWHKAQQGGKQ